jgi:hypothetical protein
MCPFGLHLTGDDGLFKQLKKALIERALGAELTEHLGYEKSALGRRSEVCVRVTNGAKARSDAVFRNPTTGTPGCCARAASGHAAAPLSSATNSRRLIPNIGASSQPSSRLCA